MPDVLNGVSSAWQWIAHHVIPTDQAARRLAEVEAELRQRDEFLSVAAHEMKTPVTTVSGYVQLLAMQYRRGMLTPERLGPAILKLETAATRLVRMQNRLLDTSRVHSGKLHIAPTPTDLNAVVCTLIEERRDNDTDHDWLVTAPREPVIANVDSLRLEQVLTNVFDNAQKFTPAGKAISARLDVTPQAIEFVVTDRGKGMPANDLTHLFERYWQADGQDEKMKGMGIGMWLSSEIVEQHGGAMSATSAPGGGLCVTVSLPLSLKVESTAAAIFAAR